ncbi:predicted protein [Nematostella vectensis]|uniref:3'-5' exoribonuclease 1 n=1 Tax=Nematostella vectensis TaxID=45351 RepID=A7RIG2_NEMVE|nr:3'-5' exoribonuclease 1 [Nematostella vectensis]EDO48700.1 predicted protein [Nematostella vectensis]|eukprot:XP_001640763.1 predicted protein [Nematostella vectensis]
MAEGSSEKKTEEGVNYDHPVYKEISLSNGMINRMKKEEVKDILVKLGLDSRGVKEVLQRRLKNHIKKEKLAKAKVQHCSVDRDGIAYYCVIDFEATCEKENPEGYQHEIIEFPAVLVNAKTLEIEGEFQQYCKPLLKPRLTKFCQELTGISQETVDKSDNFPQVLDNFHIWLKERGIGTTHKFAVVTDGPWDIQRFLVTQCEICNINLPKWSRKYINLRKHYRNFYKMKCKLSEMLENLGLEFEGRPHSGLDDSRNIARILIKMLKDGGDLSFNDIV